MTMAYDSKQLEDAATLFLHRAEEKEAHVHIGRVMETEIGWEGDDEDRHQVPIVHPFERDDEPDIRRVRAIELTPEPKPMKVLAPQPEVRFVFPQELQIEASYQRDLSVSSIILIRKIVNGWDWTKFKPPVCADTPAGLYVLDGQHTAIAAATRGIRKIPVMVVKAPQVETRASAFVAHNRDRLRMSPLQVFHAEVTAGEPLSRTLVELCARTGAVIPRANPRKGSARPGQVIPVRELKRSISAHGACTVERVLRISVGAQLAPLWRTTAVGIITVLTAPIYADVARMKGELSG